MAENRSASARAARGLHTEEPATPPAVPFRRSTSIFSRRGTDTPEPAPAFVAHPAMRLPCPRSRPRSDRPTSKTDRTNGVGKTRRAAASTPSHATVLHAVPHAKTVEMTALEEEMATSPNDEILSAIGEHAPALRPPRPGTDAHPPSPRLPPRPRSRSTADPAHRTMPPGKRDTSSRIGVWIDGVVRWDQSARDDFLSPHPAEIEHTGFTPVRPVSFAGPSNPRKPPLSVFIPGNAPAVNDRSLSTLVQPQPRRPIVPGAPATLVSKYSMSPPAIILDGVSRTPSPPERSSAATSGHKSHASVSPSSSRIVSDEESAHSRRSSATSVSLCAGSEKKFHPLSANLSVLSPFEKSSVTRANLNKSLPPTPASTPPARAALMPSGASQPRPWNALRVPGSAMLQPVQPPKQSRSMSQLDQCDEDFMRSYVACHHTQSPTLSQAEHDVRAQLSTMEEHSQDITPPRSAHENGAGTLKRRDSVRDVMQPPTRAPTIPKRSRKRDWRPSKQQARVARDVSATEPLTRRKSESHAKTNSVSGQTEIAALRKMSSVSHHGQKSRDFLVLPKLEVERSLPEVTADANTDEHPESIPAGPSPISEEGAVSAAVPSTAAEEVLLGVLSNLTSIDDLFHTAIINKGMYRVYRENEMFLLKAVMANQSPAAWELREWSPPDRNELGSAEASSPPDYNPRSYMRCFRRDMDTIERLKKMMLENCQTFIRRESKFALSTPTHPNAQRINDSFWRIWCFCEIFGGKKGREDDITGQLDWLKGGILADNQGFSATVNTNLDFDMSSVLLNAPDHFAKANVGGLSASQLFDMTETWTCLTVLLQGYSGRVTQARDHGVFDSCEVVAGDIEAEEAALEEWIAYLLTLGPRVVLDMALLASDTTPAGFAYAKQQGWTRWTPPEFNGSRSNFLKEPVAKSYEEQVAAAKLRLQDPIEREQKEMSRKRVASMAAEIKLRRQSSDYRRLPFIDMRSERAMSTASLQSTVSSPSRHRGAPSRTSHPESSSAARGAPASPALSPHSAQFLWHAPRSISPIIEDRIESFNRLSLAHYAHGQADDTSEMAVQRIVAMGFPVTRARHALRQTDLGDGLRVDRAVELLLRQA